LIIKKKKDIVESIFAKETIIMDIKDIMPHVLNSSATKIWKLLNHKPKTLDFLTNKLCERFKISRGKARKDILKFIRQLSEQKLITIEKGE